MSSIFKLHTEFQPAGDQPGAIAALDQYLHAGAESMILRGVTGSGKTYTLANVIAKQNKPVLILSHNKTLAAQLYGEFKGFFPENQAEVSSRCPIRLPIQVGRKKDFCRLH